MNGTLWALLEAFLYTVFGALLVIGIVETVKHYWRRSGQHWKNGENFEILENVDRELSALTLNLECRWDLNGIERILFSREAIESKQALDPIGFVFFQEIPLDFAVQGLFVRLRRRGLTYNYDIRPELGLALASIYPINFIRILQFPSAYIQAAGVEVPGYGPVNLLNVKLAGDLEAGVRAAVEFSEEVQSWLYFSNDNIPGELEIMAGDFGFHTGVQRKTLRPAPSNKFLRIVGAGFRDSWPVGKLPASTYSPWGERPARRSYIFTRGKDHRTTATLGIPAGVISDHAGLITTLKIYGGES